LLQVNAPLLTIHTMKEQFREFWGKNSLDQAISFLDAWRKDAENSGVKQLKKIATTLMHHRWSSELLLSPHLLWSSRRDQ
jgi:hypothetical protein